MKSTRKPIQKNNKPKFSLWKKWKNSLEAHREEAVVSNHMTWLKAVKEIHKYCTLNHFQDNLFFIKHLYFKQI